MRFILILAFLFLGFNSAQAQRFNNFSLELGGGVHIPFTPKDQTELSNFISFKQFQISGRYMFNEEIGLKGQYAYFDFQDKDNDLNKAKVHKFTLEAVYNLGELFNFSYSLQDRFTLLLHGGAGISILLPKEGLVYERIGNLQLGITPMIKITDKIAFYLDATSIMNLRQHYSYGGELLDKDYKSQSGFLLTANVGFVFYLGDYRHHADWY